MKQAGSVSGGSYVASAGVDEHTLQSAPPKTLVVVYHTELFHNPGYPED